MSQHTNFQCERNICITNTEFIHSETMAGSRTPRSDGDSRLLNAVFTRLTQPPAVKTGGYPDDIFVNLTEKEKQQLQCLICYMILRDPRQCAHGHNFCASCIYAWTLTGGAGSRTCPACRTEGRYQLNSEVSQKLNEKRVRCKTKQCKWTGCLKDFKSHRHSYGSKPSSKEYELPPIIVSSPSCSTPPSGVGFSQLTPRGDHILARPSPQRIDAMLNHRVQADRDRLRSMMDSFSQRLQNRREQIETLHELRESQRQEQLSEVHSLERRLEDVSGNLTRLMDNMRRDSERYRSYITSTRPEALQQILDETEQGIQATRETPRDTNGSRAVGMQSKTRPAQQMLDETGQGIQVTPRDMRGSRAVGGQTKTRPERK